MTTKSLGELAHVVRSKNAKPFRLTFDVIFRDSSTYERVKAAKVITPASVTQLYGLQPGELLSLHEFDAGLAIKFTLRRRTTQGSLGDTDIYGCQQHAPLLDIQVPWP